jgi:hypothetical protein
LNGPPICSDERLKQAGSTSALFDGEQAAANAAIATRRQPVRMAGYVHAAEEK